jgi:hypothetical protein
VVAATDCITQMTTAEAGFYGRPLSPLHPCELGQKRWHGTGWLRAGSKHRRRRCDCARTGKDRDEIDILRAKAKKVERAERARADFGD